ncbi:MAG: response regulator [Candidatus Moranbacteria bacterium]|jgi:DNA-binding response OmpR family regulator|nr:response regulator [Candidatus Moranbacteria bacterium]
MKKLLIVEDDPMLVEIYQKKFSQDNSFEVLISSSGLDAERKILNEKPDFVLLDLVLPERDGFEILEKIRKEKDLDKTKIIIFSNLSQPEERNRAEELGADGFIVKSENTPQQIIDKVKEFAKKFEEQ